MQPKILIGSDPEFFLQVNNRIIDPVFIPGTKENPYPLSNGIYIQKDGLAGEFNIPPAEHEDEFIESLDSAWAQIHAMIKGLADVDKTALVQFSEEEWESISYDSKVLGCSPDYDKKGRVKVMPPEAEDIPMRSAGGHIHVGWLDPSLGTNFDLVTKNKVANAVNTAIDSVLKKDEDKSDKLRRKLYGGNGAWRPKPYGIEARAPSNRWTFSPELARKVYRSAKAAAENILMEA